jgi:uncharacterized protein with HEPN domain
MSVSDLELLKYILDEINFVLDHTRGKTKNDVMNDAVLYRAVIRSIEITGEATKKLSDKLKSEHPGIEWKKMGRTRDVLIHVYFDIDNDIIWDIITEKFPPLQQYISLLLQQKP